MPRSDLSGRGFSFTHERSRTLIATPNMKEKDMNREILEMEFDQSQLKTKTGTFGNQVSYLDGAAIIARLNEAFESMWSFEVAEYKVLDEEIVVLGKLTAEGITKSQFGSTRITRHRDTGETVSIGDDLKSASTDSIKKCATLFGVGLYLYGGNGKGNGTGKAKSDNGRGQKSSSSNGSGNGRLTNKQLQAIYSIGKSKKMTQRDIKDHCIEVFNKVPDYLSKEEASTIIQGLQDR